MSLQVSNLEHNNALVELSIDEQVQIIGGYFNFSPPTPKERYEKALGKYANGQAEIGSKGDVVTFSYRVPGLFGIGSSSVVDSFRVSGDNIQSA